MSRHRYRFSLGACVVLGLWLGVGGCESASSRQGSASSVGPSRRSPGVGSSRPAAEVDLPKPPDEVPSRPLPPAETQPAAASDLRDQVPDPRDIRATLELERNAELDLIERRTVAVGDKERERREVESGYGRRIAGILEKVAAIHRPRQVEVTLADAIRRALKNNFFIQVQSYGPAIETTRIVEAEAQFDAVFFTNFEYNKQDRPTSSQLMSSLSDTRTAQSGVRKLLATGMQVQVSYALTRTWTSLVFQTLNPSYFNYLVFEFRQPFLRGFGLDYNRSQIELRRLDRAIGLERLRKDVRETVYNVEQAYWQLYQARRAVGVSARLLTDFETILEWLEQRKEAGYDVYGVQLNLTRSRIEQRRAEMIRKVSDVRNAEDALKTLLNDPDINLSEDIEIIPADAASLEALTIDELGEIAAALQYRSELKEARHTIEQTRIAVGVAKNQALPKLDVLFRYLVDGLGGNWGKAFHQMSKNDFNEYVLGIEFEWPIGNRGPEAAVRRARLQQAQAIANQRAQIEQIIGEVRQAINDLRTRWAQIGPALRAAIASRDQLRATKARQERLAPAELQVELDAHEALAGARDGLLTVLAGYNIALSNIERRKGTLLEYNNIVIRGSDDESRQMPYEPGTP
ncbi:MAG TPA: TolC family protein [Phycisphaerae bacterium]|nr:TolC family protein [Phycisphaerae bacterium]